MNTRLIRHQLRTSYTSHKDKQLILSLLDEIDRLERKDQICLSMLKQLVQIQQYQNSRRKAA